MTRETGLTLCHVLQSYDGVEVGVLDPRVIGPCVQLNCNLPHTEAHTRIMLPLHIYKQDLSSQIWLLDCSRVKKIFRCKIYVSASIQCLSLRLFLISML